MSSNPVGAPAKLHPFRGEMLRASEIARRMGLEVSTIRFRAKRGIPLDAPNHSGMTDSGVFKILSAADKLYWADDLDAIVWHLYCGGDGFGECTLEEIGALWDLSRERIRQIEASAFRKIRRKARLGDADAIACQEWIKLRMEQLTRQPATYWEQAALNAPGHFDLTGFRDNTSFVDIARKFGHAEYERQPHVRASRAASDRRKRRSR